MILNYTKLLKKIIYFLTLQRMLLIEKKIKHSFGLKTTLFMEVTKYF